MAWTQSDLDALRANIASGVMVTRFADGREVRYQSLGDMMRAEQRIAATIASASDNGRSRRRAPIYCKGV
jgi:hypothetical protein